MTNQDEIIVFRQFADGIEANIAKSKLDAYGIPCFLTEENIAALYPVQHIPGFSIRLHIFRKDSEEASSLLTVIGADTDVPEIVCPKCAGRNIEREFPKVLSEQPFSSLMILFFGVLMPQKKINHCVDCGNEF